MLWVVMWSSSSQWDLRKSFLESSRKILLFDMRGHGRRNLGLSFLSLECHWVKMWCLELWQPPCHHEEKAKNTAEKLTQSQRRWEDKDQNSG